VQLQVLLWLMRTIDLPLFITPHSMFILRNLKLLRTVQKTGFTIHKLKLALAAGKE
jgi:hypothetical protein